MTQSVYCIYSVKDVVTGNFSKPELFINKGAAERWFDGLVAESKIGKDLQLFELGVFNVNTGEINAGVIFIKGGASVNE